MSIIDRVAAVVESMPAIDRGPHLRALLATLQAYIATDASSPERLEIVIDRLLNGQAVAPGVERLDASRALAAVIGDCIAATRHAEIREVGVFLSDERGRLYNVALDRLGEAAVQYAAKVIGRERAEWRGEPLSYAQEIAICLALNEDDPPPEVVAWNRVLAAAREKHGHDVVQATNAVTFEMPDIREIASAAVVPKTVPASVPAPMANLDSVN